MTQFKNILVVLSDNIDPDQSPALLRGAALAERLGAQLTLMDVIHLPAHAINQYRGIIKPGELTDMLVKKREKELQQAAEALPSTVDFSVKVAIGRDFIEIIRQMVFASHDLLIKVANNQKNGFDSSDFHIMRKCPKPVWLLKPKDHSNCRKVLAAIDLASEDTKEGNALNLSIMNLATSLAQWEDAHLDILSCWSLYGENSLRYSGFLRVTDDEFERLITEEQNKNQSRLDALVGHYQDRAIKNKMDAHLIKGNPVNCIPEFVEQNAIDTIVMGTIGRSGIPGLLIGNTSETILHSINSSVITLKPEGFKSPVR